MSRGIQTLGMPSVSNTLKNRVVWVFLLRALGDCVLVWPLVRALVRADAHVLLVGPEEIAQLTAAELESAGPGTIQRVAPFSHQRLLDGKIPFQAPFGSLAYVSALPADNERGMTAIAPVHTHTGDSAIQIHEFLVSASASRQAVWARERVHQLGNPPLCDNPRGPLVVHVGASARFKQWPMASWHAAIDMSVGRRNCVVLAGHSDLARMDARERVLFADLSGRVCGTLSELAQELKQAKLYVGADTGPTHLAAQLGVQTLALYGPTSPKRWAPVVGHGRFTSLTCTFPGTPLSHLAPGTVAAAILRSLY